VSSMHVRGLYNVALVGAVLLGARGANAQQSTRVPGCYTASPALTYSATGEPEHGDTSWAYVRLSADGKARRPLLSTDHDRGSSWTIDGDSLTATFADGLAGWRLRLVLVPQGWSGVATYLSDAYGVGQPPYQQSITLTRRSCAPERPGA
jgi:hypothetical protein